MGVIIAIVEPRSKVTKVPGLRFSLNCPKYLKNEGHRDARGFFNPHPQDCQWKVVACSATGGLPGTLPSLGYVSVFLRKVAGKYPPVHFDGMLYLD